jgi:predicted pyridoxine 5'-phosphate oxidase superfamily flavin-nucleotide-binding protein
VVSFALLHETVLGGKLLSAIYHDGNRQLQDRFDTRRLADRLDEAIVGDTIDDNDRRFIEGADMFFIATADEMGRPNCSYKGGEPGFVRVVDEHTIAFPNYDGNGMYLTMGNLLVNPHAGLLFIDFEERHRMRINGEASIDQEDPLLAEYPEAQFIVRVRAREVFPNCPRYIHQYERVALSPFVPQEGCETPVPRWKKGDWVADVLPEHDRARDDSVEVVDR